MRAGFSSILHSGTRYVGGFKSDGLVSAIYSISEVIVAGGTPSEPDATWNVTLERTTFTDYGVLGLPLAGVYGIFPWPVSPPQYRCRLSCILLKMPAISLLTGDVAAGL